MNLPCLRCFTYRSKIINQLSNWKQLAYIQSSSVSNSKKKKFFNPYIQQYNPKINNDYVEDHLMNLHKSVIFNIDKSTPDFEEQLMNEAHYRKRMYRHSKKLQKAFGRKKKELPPLSFEQIQQIKFLHGENPELWNCSFLAMSFNLNHDQVRAVLRTKQTESEVCDNNNSNIISTSDESLPALPINTLLNIPETDSHVQEKFSKKKEFQESQWFGSFEEVSIQNEPLIEIESFDDIEDFLEHESMQDEHYEMFEIADEDIESEESEDDFEDNDMNTNSDAFPTEDHEETFEVHSNDNCNFYDNEGRFLYKVSDK